MSRYSVCGVFSIFVLLILICSGSGSKIFDRDGGLGISGLCRFVGRGGVIGLSVRSSCSTISASLVRLMRSLYWYVGPLIALVALDAKNTGCKKNMYNIKTSQCL